jgi:hypothetical protein
MKKYQKGWNIFDLLIPILAVLSASCALKYVYNKTKNTDWAFTAAFFAFIIYFIPTIYYFIKDKFVERKKAKYALHSAGLLGEYAIDSTRTGYGLFLQLIDMPIFVEIKIDESFEQRKRHALFLFENRGVLENNLREFLDKNPSYHDKKIEYICLFSEKIDQCDVYWRSDEHTRLVGLHFEELFGEYVLDLPRYGLFLKLIDMPIFVDIKMGKSIEQRKRHALFLFNNRGILENNLREFLDKNHSYRDKKIEYICLCSKNIDQCDVFWSPEGHTRLVGLHFEL